MREAFVIEARVVLERGADPRALGGAVTLALCGAFEHPGPCPLAPHRTTTGSGETGAATVRVVAACDPDRRDEATRLVQDALASGRLVDPEGVEQRWRLLVAHEMAVRDDERDLADRLAAAG